MLALGFAWWMIGRDRDVVDMLVMHGWFADGVIPNASDARISRLFQRNSGLMGSCRNLCVCHHSR